MSWDLPFDDPVPGCKTLRDAAHLILSLPEEEQARDHWLAAVEALTMAAEGRGPVMHARIGMLRAMNQGRPKPLTPRRRIKAYRVIR
jgi:hypothetical protein